MNRISEMKAAAHRHYIKEAGVDTDGRVPPHVSIIPCAVRDTGIIELLGKPSGLVPDPARTSSDGITTVVLVSRDGIVKSMSCSSYASLYSPHPLKPRMSHSDVAMLPDHPLVDMAAMAREKSFEVSTGLDSSASSSLGITVGSLEFLSRRKSPVSLSVDIEGDSECMSLLEKHGSSLFSRRVEAYEHLTQRKVEMASESGTLGDFRREVLAPILDGIPADMRDAALRLGHYLSVRLAGSAMHMPNVRKWIYEKELCFLRVAYGSHESVVNEAMRYAGAVQDPVDALTVSVPFLSLASSVVVPGDMLPMTFSSPGVVQISKSKLGLLLSREAMGIWLRGSFGHIREHTDLAQDERDFVTKNAQFIGKGHADAIRIAEACIAKREVHDLKPLSIMRDNMIDIEDVISVPSEMRDNGTTTLNTLLPPCMARIVQDVNGRRPLDKEASAAAPVFAKPEFDHARRTVFATALMDAYDKRTAMGACDSLQRRARVHESKISERHDIFSRSEPAGTWSRSDQIEGRYVRDIQTSNSCYSTYSGSPTGLAADKKIDGIPACPFTWVDGSGNNNPISYGSKGGEESLRDLLEKMGYPAHAIKGALAIASSGSPCDACGSLVGVPRPGRSSAGPSERTASPYKFILYRALSPHGVLPYPLPAARAKREMALKAASEKKPEEEKKLQRIQ